MILYYLYLGFVLVFLFVVMVVYAINKGDFLTAFILMGSIWNRIFLALAVLLFVCNEMVSILVRVMLTVVITCVACV